MPAFIESNHPRRVAHRPLLQIAVAVAIGIVFDRWIGNLFLGRGLFLWWLISASCLLIAYFSHLRKYWKFATITLLFAAMCLSASWHHLHWNYYQRDHLARFASKASEPVCLQAVALDRLKWKPAPPSNPLRALPVGPRSEIQVRVTQVRDARQWRTVNGTCKLRVNGELRDVMAGDRLLVYALMGHHTPALNPGEYDWAAAERGAGRHCELFCRAPECVTVLQRATDWSLSRWLHQVGQRCERRLAHYVGSDQSDLAQAILLGARERLQQNDLVSFLRTGTIHLLVVSGLHVGLLAIAVWIIVGSGFLPRNAALLSTALLVIAYAAIAGGRPPVVRATALVVLTLTSYVFGRKISPINLLAAAALVVLAINPTELFRSGTQLSFLCVATLAAYGTEVQQDGHFDPLKRLILATRPWYQKAFRWLGNHLYHTAVASFIIWLVVAPLVAYHFHITAPISIIVTPLLWPCVAIALFSGLAICTVAWLIPPLAWLLGRLCTYCLMVTESIVDFAQQIDVGNFYLPGPPTWWVVILYIGLMIAVLQIWPRLRWPWTASFAAVWMAVGLFVAGVKNQDEQLRCTFLSVGHGTSVVLELPGGQTMLYDAGSLGSPDRTAQTIASALWSKGITHLDAIVLSHADVDHYNALPGLIKRFEVGTIYVSPLMFDPWITDGHLDAPNYLKQTLEDAEIPLKELSINDRLSTANKDVRIEVLHPPHRGVPGQDNANSLLLAVRYAGKSILLPGDLEGAGIEAVVAERPQSFDILLAPHHGSRNSDPPGFAAWCTPKWVIVSGPYVSPEQQYTTVSYQQIGANVLHTSEVGAVQFAIGEHRLECTHFLPRQPSLNFSF